MTCASVAGYLHRMTKTRVGLLAAVTLVVVALALWLDEPERAPSVSVAAVSEPLPRPAPVLQAVSPSTPTASPVVAPAAIADPGRVAPPAIVLQPQPSAWLPPERTDLVFDLNGDARVEPDEQERAAELLERAHQFAGNRSVDGTYPILEADFRGSGRLFRAMDVDGDGALTEREFLAFEADSIRELRRYDQNADGALSKAEFGHLDSRFDFLDEDHDGDLYAWEITLMRGRGKW